MEQYRITKYRESKSKSFYDKTNKDKHNATFLWPHLIPFSYFSL